LSSNLLIFRWVENREFRQGFLGPNSLIQSGSMRLKVLVAFFLIFALLSLTLPRVQSGVFDPFHSKDEKAAMWKELWSSHSNTEYFSVGKYYDRSEMLMFVAGNQTGGRVLWDAEMHGNEDKGGEILFLLAQWLLESNDSAARSILEQNYVMFLPMVNNQVVRGNNDTAISSFGVDLNRNFEVGWQKSNPADDTYSGPNPLSEPETRVMRSIFAAYQPTFYVNLHCGAGPYAAFYKGGDVVLSENVKNRTAQICAEEGIAPYHTNSFGSNGYAIGDAAQLGVQSTWLIETVGEATAWRRLPENYDELVNTYYPKCRAIFVAMCELAAPTDQPAKVVFINQNPASNSVHSQNSVNVQATVTPGIAGIKSVTLHYISNGMDQAEVGMTKIADNVWEGTIPAFSPSTSIKYSIILEDDGGNIVSSEATVQSPTYTVLFDSQTSTPSPMRTVEPSPNPTLRPVQTVPPSSPTNDPTPLPTQDPTVAPLEKTDSSSNFQQIYLFIAVISVALVALSSFLFIRKQKRESLSVQ
jgi:hypothetical protein